MLTNAQAVEAVSFLFDDFRPEYTGHGEITDVRGRPTGGHEWTFRVWEQDLKILTDAAFPYSRPTACLSGYDVLSDLPHVERDGRLCLTRVEFSLDPAAAARQVLAEALELLEAHQTGTEDDDLKEDFSNYWNLRADIGPALSVLYEQGAIAGRYLLSGNEVFAFSDKAAMLRWWENRTGVAPKHTNAAHFIELKRLPKPSSFPADSASLLELLQTHAVDRGEAMMKAVTQLPNATVLILVGTAPSGRRVLAGVRLIKVAMPPQKNGSRHRPKVKLRPRDVGRGEQLLERYSMQRLRTLRLDSSASRSVVDLSDLAGKRVVVVGCGAIGGGVARLLAKAGVGRLDLVDHETLGWENIRRHELGGRDVGLMKVEALASDIRQGVPDISEVRAFPKTIQDLIRSGSNILEGADLIVATTGSLHADCFIDELARMSDPPTPVAFGWMEAWGVAGHALLLRGDGARFLDGFEDGVPRRPSSSNDRRPPKECGNATTPFGAIDVASVQALVSDLCLDRLLDPAQADIWRTWWTSDRNLARTEGRWTEEFSSTKPDTRQSGVLERVWP